MHAKRLQQFAYPLEGTYAHPKIPLNNKKTHAEFLH